MHAEAYEWLASIPITPNQRILEIGSRNINGSARTIFEPWSSLYVGVDIVSGNGVDFVGNIVDVRKRGMLVAMYGDDWDTIICTETFEHTPAEPLLTAIFLLARVGTTMIFTWASELRAPHSADGGPLKDGEYYQGLSNMEFASILKKVSADCYYKISVQFAGTDGDVYALVKVIGHAR